MTIDDKTLIEIIERGFRESVVGAERTCECGRIFYNPDTAAWTWESGEIEKLADNPKATALSYGVETIYLEGRHFASDCDCWHKRGLQVAKFLIGHKTEIAAFLNELKNRLQSEADSVDLVQ